MLSYKYNTLPFDILYLIKTSSRPVCAIRSAPRSRLLFSQICRNK